jgi:hypothetical protein
MGERRMHTEFCGGKTLYERPRCRWENSVKLCPQVVGWGNMDWVVVA